jgi:ABC-type multidrug transport system fused ATPase/permease subunit
MKMLLLTWTALTREERRKAILLSIGDAMVALADIASMWLLLFLFQHWLQPEHILRLSFSLNTALVLLILAFVLKNIVAYTLQHHQLHFAYRVAARVSKQSLGHFFDGEYADFVRVDASKEIRKIGQEPIEFAHYVISGWQTIASQLMLVFTYGIALLFIQPVLVPIMAVLFLPIFILLAQRSKRETSRLRSDATHKSELSIQFLREALNGFVEGRIYNSSRFLVERFVRAQSALNERLAQIQAVQFLPGRLMEVCIVCTLCVMLILSKRLDLSTVLLGAFLVSAWRIVPAMVKITNALSQIRAYAFAIPKLLPGASEDTKDFAPIQHVLLEDISFSYNGSPLWENVHARLEKGDIVGVTGRSGSGKTSFLQVLLGFQRCSSGKIVINNNSMHTAKHLQHRAAYVKQQGFFLHDTLRVNVTMEEAADQQRYQWASRLTGLCDETETLLAEDELSQEGRNISGGQRQRISFARALYKDHDLLVLDEPFSELDHEAENIFLHELQRLSGQGKIIVLVTHNKSAFSICNKIIDLDAQ